MLCGLSSRSWGFSVPNLAYLSDALTRFQTMATQIGVSDAQIHLGAYNLSQLMTTVHGKAIAIRNWDIVHSSELPETPATVERLQESAEKKASRMKVPPPTRRAMIRASLMNRAGLMGFADLPKHVLGLYQYWKKNLRLGFIKLHKDLPFFALLVGDDLAYDPVIHENTHAENHQEGDLGEESIKDEMKAFHNEQQWLKIVDPYGERVCFLRAKLMNLSQRYHFPIFNRTLTFLEHLAEIQATGGDEEKLRQVVLSRGYRNDDHERRGPMSS